MPTRRRSRRSTPASAQRAAIPPIRSLSVGARQSARAGGAAKAGCWRWPSSSSGTVASAVGGGRGVRGAGLPAPTGTCTAQTSKPCGAQSDASAVVTRTVRNASPEPSGGATQPGSSTFARSPGPSAGSSNAPPAISAPSTVNE